MLSDVMGYYSLTRNFQGAGYFETEHHQQILALCEIQWVIKF